MNTPNSIAKQSLPGEPTSPYQTSGASADGPAGRIKVALVAGSGPQPSTDLQSLLHKRLRFLAFLLSGGLAVALLCVAVTKLPLDAWEYFAIAMYVPAALLAGVLSARRSLSLSQLRAIELVLFGALYAQWSLVHAFLYPTMDLPEPPIWFGFILGYAVSLPWAFLIMAYGIFIPNTWRRCAAVVGVMAVTPLAISTANGLAAKATAGHSQANYLIIVGACMAAAAAIAICGSHRIEVLRQQAFEARKLGQYVLKGRLGSGGMGEVYLAEPLLLRRPCAIKLIRPERAGDPNILRRFEREVQATATLTHPNTVQIFDYGHAEDGTFYYVMEYLPGLSLEQLVNRHGPLPPERAVHLLQQVCGALREAHGIGLIHRDIKPSNILICERGGVHDVAKLVDFGLVLAPGVSADGANLTQEGAIAGTPAYMSPEQAGGQENLDPRSDIYSLGVVAYFLLTGQPPFAGRSPVKMVAAHIYEPPAPVSNHRPDVSEDLQAVVLRCLAKDPADRFADVESLERALAGCYETGQWSEKQAANWWRVQAGPSRTVVSDKGNSEPGLTRS